MGNQQSKSRLQFCSTEPNPLSKRFMVVKDFRVDYLDSKKRSTENEKLPKQRRPPMVVHLQSVVGEKRWQQNQEVGAIPKFLKVQVEPVIFLGEDEANVFEGILSDIIPNNGFVGYTESVGNDFHVAEETQESFAMGISFGGLTKSLWFKDVKVRDACFKSITGTLSPPHTVIIHNPEYVQGSSPLRSFMSEDEPQHAFNSIKVFDDF